ncbi:Machado-Joseph disease protein 1 (Ataxin-3) [Pseudohyphozyma bogoriensis]|nr:Machado-Joseph disease protein 1 (Ataxin-3) [Pseudohyphozyma bogoriensis]
MSSTDAATLYWLNEPAAALEALRDELGFGPPSSSFIPNVYVVVGLHAGLIALYLLMYFLWLAKGGTNAVPRAGKGSKVARSALLIGYLAYSVAWIVLLLLVFRTPVMHNVAFQFMVYLPLPVTGWIQTHLLLRALPARRAVIQLHPPRGPLSTFNRMTDSRITQTALFIALPIITVSSELPFPILAGRVQKVLYSEYRQLASTVSDAVEGGTWGTTVLTELAPLLEDIAAKGAGLNDYCTWHFYVILAWTCAIGAVYIPYTIMMQLLLRKQVQHLKLSLSHMADVNALRTTVDPAHATQSFEERHAPLSTDVGYPGGDEGKSRNPGYEKEVREKLRRVTRVVHVVYFLTGPKSWGGISREVLVYLPSYTYLPPAYLTCFSTIWFYLRERRHRPAAPTETTGPTAAPNEIRLVKLIKSPPLSAAGSGSDSPTVSPYLSPDCVPFELRAVLLPPTKSESLESWTSFQGSMMCLQHSLNNLFQQPMFTPQDLADVARQLDALEHAQLDEAARGGESQNYDDSGFFSVMVMEEALKVLGVKAVRWKSPTMRSVHETPDHDLHWFTIRRFAVQERFYNLDSCKDAPEWISPMYLGLSLAEAENQGYSIFVIVPADDSSITGLPPCDASVTASSLPNPTSRYGSDQPIPTTSFGGGGKGNVLGGSSTSTPARTKRRPEEEILVDDESVSSGGEGGGERRQRPRLGERSPDPLQERLDEEDMMAMAIAASLKETRLGSKPPTEGEADDDDDDVVIVEPGSSTSAVKGKGKKESKSGLLKNGRSAASSASASTSRSGSVGLSGSGGGLMLPKPVERKKSKAEIEEDEMLERALKASLVDAKGDKEEKEEEEEEEENENGSPEEDDAPTMEELRRRRLARFGG